MNASQPETELQPSPLAASGNLLTWAGTVLLVTCLLAGLAALTVYNPIYVNLPINVGIPLALFALGRARGFEAVKLGTLTLNRALIVVAVLGLMTGALYIQITFWLLRINILEAIVKDYSKKNYYNVASGVILMLFSFLFAGTWLGNFYLTQPATLIYWGVAYTIWNWNFVNLNFKAAISAFHLAVLAAPLAYCLVTLEPGFWLIIRATSLTIAGSLQVGWEEKVVQFFENAAFAKRSSALMERTPQIVFLVSVLMLCLVAYLLH